MKTSNTHRRSLLTLYHVALGAGEPLKGILILKGSPVFAFTSSVKPSLKIFGAPKKCQKLSAKPSFQHYGKCLKFEHTRRRSRCDRFVGFSELSRPSFVYRSHTELVRLSFNQTTNCTFWTCDVTVSSVRSIIQTYTSYSCFKKLIQNGSDTK